MTDETELTRIGAGIDAPLLYNCSGGPPVVSFERAEELGYNLVMFPRMSTNPNIAALFDAYGRLDEEGMDAWRETKTALEDLPIESYDEFAGVPEILELEERFLPDDR